MNDQIENDAYISLIKKMVIDDQLDFDTIKMWLLENGGDAKYGNHKINNSQARIHIHARLLSNSV